MSTFLSIKALLEEGVPRRAIARRLGIGMLTPATVHFGQADAALAARQVVLDRAHRIHPERFVHGRPTPQEPPTEVWINKPVEEPEEELAAH